MLGEIGRRAQAAEFPRRIWYDRGMTDTDTAITRYDKLYINGSWTASESSDSIDVIDDDIMLPELEVGDLVVGRMMGAYTWASATDFNFFKRAKVVVMNERPADAKRVVRLQRKASAGRSSAA